MLGDSLLSHFPLFSLIAAGSEPPDSGPGSPAGLCCLVAAGGHDSPPGRAGGSARGRGCSSGASPRGDAALPFGASGTQTSVMPLQVTPSAASLCRCGVAGPHGAPRTFGRFSQVYSHAKLCKNEEKITRESFSVAISSPK